MSTSEESFVLLQKRRKDEEQRALEEKEQEEKELVLLEERRLEEIERQKEEIRNNMPQEPDLTEEDIIKILLKLPNGTRLERRFMKSQSLQVCSCIINSSIYAS